MTPVDDILIEGTENYILSIEVNSGPAIVEVDLATVNIADNDGKFIILFLY